VAPKAGACIDSAEKCTVAISRIVTKAQTGAAKCAQRQSLTGADRNTCALGADPATPLNRCVRSLDRITPDEIAFCGAAAAAAVGAANATCTSAINNRFADYDLYL